MDLLCTITFCLLFLNRNYEKFWNTQKYFNDCEQEVQKPEHLMVPKQYVLFIYQYYKGGTRGTLN